MDPGQDKAVYYFGYLGVVDIICRGLFSDQISGSGSFIPTPILWLQVTLWR